MYITYSALSAGCIKPHSYRVDISRALCSNQFLVRRVLVGLTRWTARWLQSQADCDRGWSLAWGETTLPEEHRRRGSCQVQGQVQPLSSSVHLRLPPRTCDPWSQSIRRWLYRGNSAAITVLYQSVWQQFMFNIFPYSTTGTRIMIFGGMSSWKNSL